MTAGALERAAAGVPLEFVIRMPFEGYLGPEIDTIAVLEGMLGSGAGIAPAAIIVETVQAEGGINVASSEWLRRLQDVADRHEIVLIVDDIQVGCGRTGRFFSFERAGIVPGSGGNNFRTSLLAPQVSMIMPPAKAQSRMRRARNGSRQCRPWIMPMPRTRPIDLGDARQCE